VETITRHDLDFEARGEHVAWLRRKSTGDDSVPACGTPANTTPVSAEIDCAMKHERPIPHMPEMLAGLDTLQPSRRISREPRIVNTGVILCGNLPVCRPFCGRSTTSATGAASRNARSSERRFGRFAFGSLRGVRCARSGRLREPDIAPSRPSKPAPIGHDAQNCRLRPPAPKPGLRPSAAASPAARPALRAPLPAWLIAVPRRAGWARGGSGRACEPAGTGPADGDRSAIEVHEMHHNSAGPLLVKRQRPDIASASERSAIREEAVLIKLVTFLKGNALLDRSAFFARWHDKHAPMAAIFPGLRAYVLSREVSHEAAADAFAELWFDDREAVQSAYSSDVGRSGSADANTYTSRRRQALLDETWLNGPGQPMWGLKQLVAVKRPAAMTRAEFLHWWEGPIAALARAQAGGRRLRLCADRAGLVLNSDPASDLGLVAGEGEADGLIEIWASPGEGIGALDDIGSTLLEAVAPGAARAERLRLDEHRIV